MIHPLQRMKVLISLFHILLFSLFPAAGNVSNVQVKCKGHRVVPSDDDEPKNRRVVPTAHAKRKVVPAAVETVAAVDTVEGHKPKKSKKSKKGTAPAKAAAAATQAAGAVIDEATPTPLFDQTRARKLIGKGEHSFHVFCLFT